MSLSLLVSNVYVTGSNLVYQANLSGIGGTQVIRSGNYVLISGGAGGGGAGDVTQAQLNSLSGFTTGISGYLQGQITTNVANFGFISNVPTGTDSFFVPYPIGLTGVPILGVTMETNGVVDVPSLAISGRTSAGFSTLLSDSALMTGLSLNVLVQGVADMSSVGYVSGVPTGVASHFFHFPNYTFTNPPKINITWETELSNVVYGGVISGRATTGFNFIFSDSVLETGLYLNILAKA